MFKHVARQQRLPYLQTIFVMSFKFKRFQQWTLSRWTTKAKAHPPLQTANPTPPPRSHRHPPPTHPP